MKNNCNKKQPLLILAIVILFCMAAAFFLLPGLLYKPYSFVVDGETFSAEVIQGEEMELTCFPLDEDGHWMVAASPGIYLHDSSSDHQEDGRTYTKMHFTARGEGNGYTRLMYLNKDQVVTASFELKMFITRHGRHLQIEEVSITPM